MKKLGAMILGGTIGFIFAIGAVFCLKFLATILREILKKIAN